MKKLYVLFAAAVALALLQGGCGGGGGGTGGGTTGRLSLIADFQNATRTVPGYADALLVTVAPPTGVTLPGTFPNPFLLDRSNTSRTLDGLTPSTQPYVLDMKALTDGMVVGTAQRSIFITAGAQLEIDVSANLQSAVDSVTVEGVSSTTSGNYPQFTAVARDAQGAALFSGAGFTWTSSNPGALSVDLDTGLATAITSGIATISAALSGTSLSGQLEVRVDSGGNVSLTILSKWESATRDVPGYADELRVTVTAPPGVPLFIFPNPFILTRATQVRGLTGLMSDVDPYTVSMEALTDGVVVGTAVRNVVITEGEHLEIDVSANLQSTVDSVTVEGVSLVTAGDDTQYTAFAKDVLGATLFTGLGFTWTSSNPGALSVDQATGLATANTAGTATVVATLTGTVLSGQLGVTVEPQTMIAFMSDRDGNPEIYVMNADGTGQTRLTDNAANDAFPAFSPDGSKIAFHSRRDGNREIYVMNADGTAQTRLTNNAVSDGFPAFSWTKIAFTSGRDGNWEIYVMNADGSGQTNLTNNAAGDVFPSFSPDGSKIAFMSIRDIVWEIYVMNADGTGQTRLTSNGSIDRVPAFSPDGSKIAFSSGRDGNEEIYVMNADGSEQTRLTNSAGIDARPVFSPDGSKIVFHSDRDGNGEIYIMNADGTGVTRLTNNPATDWDPSFPLLP